MVKGTLHYLLIIRGIVFWQPWAPLPTPSANHNLNAKLQMNMYIHVGLQTSLRVHVVESTSTYHPRIPSETFYDLKWVMNSEYISSYPIHSTHFFFQIILFSFLTALCSSYLLLWNRSNLFFYHALTEIWHLCFSHFFGVSFFLPH